MSGWPATGSTTAGWPATAAPSRGWWPTTAPSLGLAARAGWRPRTLHGLFEADGFRAAVLRWAAAGPASVGRPASLRRRPGRARFDRIADALEAHLDLDRLFALIEAGAPSAFCSRKRPDPAGAIRREQKRRAEVAGGVTGLVPHLRWRIGPPGDGDLLGADLAADPDRLAAEVAATAAGRGSDDPQVLASLWWQAYAYRVAGTTLAAWVVAGAAPDPAAPGTGVGLARSRPSSLLVDPDAVLVDDLDDLVRPAVRRPPRPAHGRPPGPPRRRGRGLLPGPRAAGNTLFVDAAVPRPSRRGRPTRCPVFCYSLRPDEHGRARRPSTCWPRPASTP